MPAESELAIAVFPHLIPASTVPNGDIERAMSEPLAHGRDEVLYLVCTHDRVCFGPQEPDGRFPVHRAVWQPDGGVAWDANPWARIALPEHARPSAIPWAVIDPMVESEEGVPPIQVNPRADPDGEEGQHRVELLPWIFDRHLELGSQKASARGIVEGGHIELRVEYIGKSGEEALRRATGAHHKVPRILSALMLREPHRIVYFLPCEIRLALFESDEEDPVKAELLRDAVAAAGIPRSVFIAAAEEALIEALGTPYNKQNTVTQRFPRSAAGVGLATQGIRQVMLAFYGLPPCLVLNGERASVDADSTGRVFSLA